MYWQPPDRLKRTMICPVCIAASVQPLMAIDGRRYLRCPTCKATVLDPTFHITTAEEKAHYDHHQNDPEDQRYRAFLGKLANPLMQRLAPGSSGLDYGCGPGPALATMLHEAGHRMAIYDPFYAADASVLKQTYDFVTCTEVAEHFHHPAKEFARMMATVRPGGWLAVMTCFQTDDSRFADWHYRKDPTHVVFYREETLRHIAAAQGWSCDIPAKDVVLMQRPDAALSKSHE
ncbi:MAG: class I SAM-dependent methyltransferase [Paracoccaceae bacterium]